MVEGLLVTRFPEESYQGNAATRVPDSQLKSADFTNDRNLHIRGIDIFLRSSYWSFFFYGCP